MIPLGGSDFPKTTTELADALRITLREIVRLPDERTTVTVDADQLRIDLSGGSATIGRQLDDTNGVGRAQPGPNFKTLDVLAHPVMVEGAKFHLDVTAENVRFNYDRTRADRPVLVLVAATDGRVAARILRTDLQTFLTARARAAAREYGVEIERIDLNVTQLGPRSVRIDAKAAVQTKALFKTIQGAVTFAGRADIDDRLVAKLSGLNIVGEGMMIALAVNLVRGKFSAFEGKEFQLTTFAPGAVLLRDVQLQVGDELTVTAAFGS
jgi:hypothetical protein